MLVGGFWWLLTCPFSADSKIKPKPIAVGIHVYTVYIGRIDNKDFQPSSLTIYKILILVVLVSTVDIDQPLATEKSLLV